MKKIIDYLLSIIYLLHFGLSLLVFHIAQVVALNVFGKKAHEKIVDYLNFSLTYGLISYRFQRNFQKSGCDTR